MFARHHWQAGAAAIVVVAIQGVSAARGSAVAAVALVVLLVLVAAAVLLARDPEQRGNAALLEVAAATAAVGEFNGAFDVGIELAFAAAWWPIVALSWFFLRYPDHAIRVRWHRALLALIAVASIVLWGLNALLWDPVRIGLREPNDWFTIGNWERARTYLQFYTAWALSLALLLGAAGLVGRWRRARGMVRPAIAWVACVGASLAAIIAVTIWSEWALPWYTHRDLNDLSLYRTGALGVATIALFVEAVRRRTAAVGIIDHLLRAVNDADGVTAVLRSAFADPQLRSRSGGRGRLATA